VCGPHFPMSLPLIHPAQQQTLPPVNDANSLLLRRGPWLTMRIHPTWLHIANKPSRMKDSHKGKTEIDSASASASSIPTTLNQVNKTSSQLQQATLASSTLRVEGVVSVHTEEYGEQQQRFLADLHYALVESCDVVTPDPNLTEKLCLFVHTETMTPQVLRLLLALATQYTTSLNPLEERSAHDSHHDNRKMQLAWCGAGVVLCGALAKKLEHEDTCLAMAAMTTSLHQQHRCIIDILQQILLTVCNRALFSFDLPYTNEQRHTLARLTSAQLMRASCGAQRNDIIRSLMQRLTVNTADGSADLPIHTLSPPNTLQRELALQTTIRAVDCRSLAD
jgi:hypothetical protein